MNPEACTLRHQAGIVWRRERTAGSRWQWDTDTPSTGIHPWKRGPHPKQKNTEIRALLLVTPRKYAGLTTAASERHWFWRQKAYLEGSSTLQLPGDEGKERNKWLRPRILQRWGVTTELELDSRPNKVPLNKETAFHGTDRRGCSWIREQEATRAPPSSPQNHM